jgi:predicted nuclease of restriction endonuclease-like (RecB) superfamily
MHVLTNFEIGRRIVEHEQQGRKRAGYGTELLKELAARLTEEFGKGFSRSNLENMRRFYLTWQDRVPEVAGQESEKLLAAHGTDAFREKIPRKRAHISQQAIGKFRSSFSLNWTHYLILLTIKDPDERQFYEIEAASEGWSVPELKRQIASSLYERLALSRDKAAVRKLSAEGQVIERPEDVLKEPYVLEFLGLEERAAYSETDLEQAIIHRLEHFLLELGKGFLFESRQHRFTFDEDHFFVDLVFYNRLLRAYVLIDLKLDKLTHQDLGQMQMYVNWFDRHKKLPEENPTIGILLCKRKKDAIVELTLPPDANIHAKQYKLYLPSKELLREKLIEWGREKDGLA